MTRRLLLPQVLAILQAGGKGSRMDVLTRERAKPLLPFAGTYALIDFTLSSVMHAGVADVWVSVQYLANGLDAHLSGGRPWDLDRTRGGYRRMVPQEGSGPAFSAGFSHGNADDLYRLRDEITAADPEVIVVASCDHVINLDLRAVLARHLEAEAECTIVTAEVGVREAQHKVVVDAAADGTVREVVPKPERPSAGTVATEIFVYDAQVLVEELETLRRSLHPTTEDDHDTGLGDFGEHLLPRLVERGRTIAADVAGYWKDVGRPEAYLQAHRDLLAGRVDVFAQPDRPVLGRQVHSPAAMVLDEGRVQDAMLSPGCRVRGTVRRSVLGPGVQVQAGAVVEDSVLMSDVVVEAGARVATSVIDQDAVVGRDASVGTRHLSGPLTGDHVALVGRECRIRRGTSVAGGARLEPGSTT